MVIGDFSILNFGKILLRFAIVFKIFECICPFLSLKINAGQRSFSSLADGFVEIIPHQIIVLNVFTEKSESFFKKKFANFLNISFFD